MCFVCHTHGGRTTARRIRSTECMVDMSWKRGRSPARPRLLKGPCCGPYAVEQSSGTSPIPAASQPPLRADSQCRLHPLVAVQSRAGLAKTSRSLPFGGPLPNAVYSVSFVGDIPSRAVQSVQAKVSITFRYIDLHGKTKPRQPIYGTATAPPTAMIDHCSRYVGVHACAGGWWWCWYGE